MQQQNFFHQQIQQQQVINHIQATEANIPQSSHVRVASANQQSAISYLSSSNNYNQVQQPAYMQNEAVRKIACLKKAQGTHSNGNMGVVRKQLSHGDIAGFVQQQQSKQAGANKTTVNRHHIAGSTSGQYLKGGANSHQYSQQQFYTGHHQSQSPEQQYQQQIDSNTQIDHNTNASSTHIVQNLVSKVSNQQRNSYKGQHMQQAYHSNGSKSPKQPQMLHYSHQQQQSQVVGQSPHLHVQKRASPASGVAVNHQVEQQPVYNQFMQSQQQQNVAGQNLTRKQVKLAPSSSTASSSKLFVRGSRGSNSPMNQLQAQIQSQQTRSGMLTAQQSANATVSQKIKFLLRGKEGQAAQDSQGQRQITARLSKQKSPKFLQEIDNNTQATFGVDENIKENRQMNFQMNPQIMQLAQESPSIGEEISAAHPHLQPNISSSNLRGPLNFVKKPTKVQPAFAGIEQSKESQAMSPGIKIQTEEEQQQNPPNAGLQKKQFSQNLRYQVSSLTPSGQQYVSAPSVSQLSAMVDAQAKSGDKSPVHIHYHNHIQVINSSDLKGANVIASTATPSKSPKQLPVASVVDSLQKPRISKQPSQTNLAAGRANKPNESAPNAMQMPPKRFSIKQGTGASKFAVGANSKLGSVTPRLISNVHMQQKSTPNLKTNLQVVTKHQSTASTKLGVHHVSPAGKAALALLGQGHKSQIDLSFADSLSQKLLDAQQNQHQQPEMQVVAPAEADLNTLTDSVDGSKVTSDALKKLQPIQSVTPSKLQHVVSKKQQTASVPPLKLNQEKLDQHSKEPNLHVHAQASTSSSKQQQNTGRVSHRLKQMRRNQNSSDVNVYKHTASQKSSVGNTVRQPVLSSSGASSNSLKSLGLAGQSNKSANTILINELSKYINIKQSGGQKRFQPLSSKMRKTSQIQGSTAAQKRASEQPQVENQGQENEEVLENLRHFLHFLERKKIINITEVIQDKAKIKNLVQEIMKIDLKDFSKQSSQKFKKLRGSSGSESNGSQNRVQVKRRQGTPVNINSGATPRQENTQGEYSYSHQVSDQHNQISSAEHNLIDSQKISQAVGRQRADSKNSSYTNLPIHHLNLQQQNLAQKESQLPGQQSVNQTQLQQQPSSRMNNYMTNMSSAGTNASMMGTSATANAQQIQGGFQSTNQSSVIQMQQLQHNYSSANNYVSDSSNGVGVNQNKIGDQLMKYSNVTATSRNPRGHTGGVSGSTTTNTAKGRSHASQGNMHQMMNSSNEQIGVASQNNVNGPNQSSQNYANYKAVAVSQSKGSKMPRKGNSADPSNDHSSKKQQFRVSGLWDLANQRNDSETGSNQAGVSGHQRRASEGQIIQRGRGTDSQVSATKQTTGAQRDQHQQRRYKSRGGSADQGKQREVLRLSRGSSAKRTAKEIVDYIVIDEDRFRVNDNIMKERERLIKYNKLYLKKYRQLPPTTQDFYEFVELIGKGAFGQVTLAIHKLTGRQVAIKAINKSYMQDVYSKQKVMQEVYILKKIRHSNIIRLFEVFQSPKHFLLVMEYADGGDLLQFVKKRQHLDEETAKRIFKQVVHGVAHCHCRSVLHRDIKLDNILMDFEGGIKICDFGVSRLITKNQSIQEQCGTPAYLAPEIIADQGYRGYYVDLWSLGVLLYAMLQGTVPFKAKSLEALHALIMTEKLDYPVPISDQALNLIQSMLKIEPEERIDIPSILKHPWLKTTSDYEIDEEDDDHDFEMGISFRRQECNFNPLSQMGMGDAPQNTNRQRMNPEMEAAEETQESNDENLLTEQETNPMQQIGNINVLKIENLFHEEDDQAKEPVPDSGARLTYDNYCAVTQDFGTHRIDEEALKVLEGFGYPRKLVIDSLNNGELNHATTCYNLLVTQ